MNMDQVLGLLKGVRASGRPKANPKQRKVSLTLMG